MPKIIIYGGGDRKKLYEIRNVSVTNNDDYGDNKNEGSLVQQNNNDNTSNSFN